MADDKFTIIKDIWQHIPKPTTESLPLTTDEVEDEPAKEIMILGEKYQGLDIKDKINSLIWLSYRTSFEPIIKHPEGPHPLQFISSMVFNKNPFLAQISSLINNDYYTTDVGWGCMIRTSQSLLANTLIKLGHNVDTTIAKFYDNSQAVYSLHNFVKVANESPLQVKPGEWFGPNAASLSIKRLCHRQLSVYITETSDIYDDDIIDDNMLILLTVRLGIDKINHVYYDAVKQLLSLKQSVGIAGGRPSSSFYFVGVDDDNNELIYLDPHYPQISDDQQPSYHTDHYHTLKIADLDPSMMIGILITSYQDYIDLKQSLQHSTIVHFHRSKHTVDNDIDVQSIDEEVPETTVDNTDDTNTFVTIHHNIQHEDVVEVDHKLDSSYDVI